MKTILHSIFTLSFAAAVLTMTSCQSYNPPLSNHSNDHGNVRPFNMSGITPRS